MTNRSDIIFSVTPPSRSGLRVVTLSSEQWHRHIIVGHSEMVNHLKDIEVSITSPTVLLENTDRPNHLLFVNENVLSPRRRHPLTVVVKSVGDHGHVATAHFRKVKPDAKRRLPIEDSESDD